MADSKLSELTAATTAAATDTAYLVQSSVSKQITVANLFGNVSTPVQFTNSIQVGDHNEGKESEGIYATPVMALAFGG